MNNITPVSDLYDQQNINNILMSRLAYSIANGIDNMSDNFFPLESGVSNIIQNSLYQKNVATLRRRHIINFNYAPGDA